MHTDHITKISDRMSKLTEIVLPESVVKREILIPARSTPDSSTDSWGCPQCGMGNESEVQLLEHLLHEHKIRVIPPQSPTRTRCPVCRQHVADLSQHFALEHADQRQAGKNQEKTQQPQGLPSGASVTRIIPIVLPSKPASPALTMLQDSEAHLLESVVSNNRQQITEEFANPNSNDNYRSNGESTRSSTPNSINNDNPVNLSMRREFQQNDQLTTMETHSSDSGSIYQAGAASSNSRKRRKQTHVPDTNKDERYWARRLKNNEAAKKSRDMRIKREKVIFEENMRLENIIKELRADNNSYITENKELHLKLGIILEENARLKAFLQERN